MRVLVCGGRHFADARKKECLQEWKFVNEQLDSRFRNALPEVIIHGAAHGVDLTAHVWAFSKGVPVEQYPANWERYGKKAGFLRNKQMLEEGKPDLVIAFPGGVGTAMMVGLAIRAGIPVDKVVYNA